MGSPADRPLDQAGPAQASAPRRVVSLAVSAPNAAGGLTDMLVEIDRLRGETERLRGRIRELEALADCDPLLPVFNRRAFARELARAVALSERYEEPLGLAYFDLNGFKTINDAYGHATGDAVLSHVAEILRANVRSSDIVARLGGDEFGVILFRSDLNCARMKASQLADLVQCSPAIIEGVTHHVGAAWGACAYVAGDTAEALLERADAAMYAEKRPPAAAAAG